MKGENMKFVLSILALQGLAGASALGQQVEAWVGTNRLAFTTTDGGDLTIPLGQISVDTVLRIFDSQTNSTTPPGLSVGKVTVNGSVATGSGAMLRILVASSNVTTFPASSDSNQPISTGVVNLGRSTGTDPSGIVIPDATLQHNTVLALAASGNLTGDITVGRVFRIQALGRTVNNQYLGGTIASNIMATASDDEAGFSVGELAINHIVAGDLISGNILATGYDNDSDPYNFFDGVQHRGTIGRITVARIQPRRQSFSM